jgi:hypothetical protein
VFCHNKRTNAAGRREGEEVEGRSGGVVGRRRALGTEREVMGEAGRVRQRHVFRAEIEDGRRVGLLLFLIGRRGGHLLILIHYVFSSVPLRQEQWGNEYETAEANV